MKMRWLVLGLLSIVLGAGNAVASSPELSENAQASLLVDIEIGGKTSVIVEYQTLLGGVNSLATVQGEGRLPVITAMHQQFSGSLSAPLANAITGTFSYVPGVVMSVDQEQLQEIRSNPYVKQVHRNRARRISLEESIGLVSPSKATGQFSGKGQTIAVIDTGVDGSHSFFSTDGASRMVDGACYSGGGFTNFREAVTLCPNRTTVQLGAAAGVDCTRFSFPGCDHGTHVAGIAAGNGGVANEANIIGIQAFTGLRDLFRRNLCGTGVGKDCVVAFDSDILKALERVFALRNTYNIAAVNMSLGGGQYRSACDGVSPMVTGIVNQLKAAGIATVASSGNNGFLVDAGWPSCITNVVSVGATSDFTGTVFGRSVILDFRTFYSNSSSALDLYAPGTLIRSSVPGNGFANFNGTSMASPHVAGAFAVIKARKNTLSVDDIENTLKSVGPLVSQSGVSRRRIDIGASLTALGLGNAPVSPILQLLLMDSE